MHRTGKPGAQPSQVRDGTLIVETIFENDEGSELFERLLSLRNDVGLLAEEYDPRVQRQVGNFPQALSHIALVNSAFEFTREVTPGEQRAESKPATAESGERRA